MIVGLVRGLETNEEIPGQRRLIGSVSRLSLKKKKKKKKTAVKIVCLLKFKCLVSLVRVYGDVTSGKTVRSCQDRTFHLSMTFLAVRVTPVKHT